MSTNQVKEFKKEMMVDASNVNMEEVMLAEYKKCATDPIYFFMKYVYIQTSKGRGKFQLYEFQKKLLHILHTKDRTIVLKSRQMGITTLSAGYALWCMLFIRDYSVLALAPDQDKSKEIISKISFGYENLPAWLIRLCKAGSTENNKFSLKLNNGSRAVAASGASKSARGKTANLLILDEVAFIDHADELFASAQQTLSTGNSKAILLSTPNGNQGFFHEMWVKAEMQANDFVPIRLPWNLHPERDEKWRKKQDEELGVRLANQECNCSFLTSGDGFFESEDIEYYKSLIETPKSMSGPGNDYWVWEDPDYSRSYIISCDVSRGDGNDFNAFQIIDVFTGNQVAEYKGDIDIKLYPQFILSKAMEYNSALIVVENVGIGQSVLNAIITLGYNNIYYTPKGNTTESHKFLYLDPIMNPDKFTAGFTTSTTTRPLMCLVLKGYVHDKIIRIRSKRVIAEMSTFIWKNGKEIAANGYNDDALMSLAIALYLRNTAMNQSTTGVDMYKALLSNVRVSTPVASSGYNNYSQNPYQMNIGNGQMEDIRWAL